MAAHTRAYDQSHPWAAASRADRRREHELAAGLKYVPADIAVLRMRQSDHCGYCEVALDGGGHVDHMTPISRGGTHDILNLVLACFQCNTEKHAKTAGEYFLWRITHGMTVSGYAYELWLKVQRAQT